MLDFRHLPPANLLNTTVFYAAATTSQTSAWQTWNKPRGCSLVYILSIGGGGGGARSAAGSGNSGGGGGGTGAIIRALIPAQFLPDYLYIRPGNGGLGATTTNTAGSSATVSNVSYQPATGVNAYILINGCNGLGGAAAGTGGGTNTANISLLGLLGPSTIFTGSTGGAGGATTANGTSITFASTTGLPPLTAGAGGGGANASTNGGGITVTNSFPFPTLAGTTGAGLNGYGYNKRIDPNNPNDLIFAFTGGCGGGGSATTGSAGGHGGYGCGGGGGGGANTTTGNGGNGGDGLIIISAW